MADNFEARMNFIIEQQAQFSADIQLLKERETETLRMIGQLVDVTMSLAHHGEETDRRLQETDQRIRTMGEETDQYLRAMGEETDQRFRAMGEETDRRIRELVESGAHTDRRLDALIVVVDKLVRRNGA